MIEKDNPVVAGAAMPGPSSRAVALRDKLGWLQEWGRALQELHSRSRGNARAESGVDHHAIGSLDHRDARRLPGNATESERGREKAQAAGEKRTAGGADQRFTEVGAETQAGVPEPAALVGGAPVFQSTIEPERPPAAVPVTRWPKPVSQERHWQPYNVHVVEAENAVKVWIRCAGLEAGARLLAAIRAELQGAGRSLAYVAINGKCVWELPKASVGEPETESDDDVNRIV